MSTTTQTTQARQGGYNRGEVQQVTLSRATRLRQKLAAEIGMIEERIFTANTRPSNQQTENVSSLMGVRSNMTAALADLDTAIAMAYSSNQGEGWRLQNACVRSNADAAFFGSIPSPRGSFSRGGTTREYNAQLRQSEADLSQIQAISENDTLYDQLQAFEFKTQVAVPTVVVTSNWYAGIEGVGQGNNQGGNQGTQS